MLIGSPTPGAPPALVSLPQLPEAGPGATLGGLPRDPQPHDPPLPQRLHALTPATIHPAPEAPPVAVLPSHILGDMPLWTPVIQADGAWARVLLPCQRDGATGWIRLTEQVAIAVHPIHVEIDCLSRTIALIDRRYRQGWSAGVGKANSPTPRGRSFVLGLVDHVGGLVDQALLIAAHAHTHLSYRGYPGVLGVHTWPRTADVSSQESDGSVLVAPQAMSELAATAIAGTAVLIH